MSNIETGRTVKRRHLHYVLRTGTPEPRTPMFDSVESWNWAVRISVVGLFVVALAVIAFKMASVVVPVVLAWVVAMVLLPVVDALERRGLSRALTSIVLVILLITSIMVIVGVLTVPLTYWLRRGSELGVLLKERLETLGNPLAFFDEIGNALSKVTGGDESASAVNLSSSTIVTVILSVLTPLVSETLIFLVSLVFNLIYHRDIQSGMLLVFRNDSARQRAKDILKDIQVNTSIYFGTLTVVNICLGDCGHGADLAGGAAASVPVGHACRGAELHTLCGCRDSHRDALRRRPLGVFLAQSRTHRAARLSRYHRTGGTGHHADPPRSSPHDQSISRFPLHRMLELDVGTGRRVPGRAHSLVRDGGGAPVVIDRRRECRSTRDCCGWPGELMVRARQAGCARGYPGGKSTGLQASHQRGPSSSLGSRGRAKVPFRPRPHSRCANGASKRPRASGNGA